MILTKVYSISSFFLVFHWCTLSVVLCNRQIRADLEGSNDQPNFRNKEVTLPTFEEQSINCVNSTKDNLRYSSSFTELDEELSIVKNPKEVVKEIFNDEKSNSIRFNEATTLCWIERIVIKEDLSFEPPKRLVFKEYAISFENSATIPEEYLDCRKIKGEISSSDSNVDKTVFYETIDENTKVSRVINFTKVRNEIGIKIWEHKSVKCGMGSIVSKSLMEWDVDSKNPKKRLEIKVGPTIRSLKAPKAIDTSELNVVSRMWSADNNLLGTNFKTEEFTKETTKFADHRTTDATEVIEIVDQSTVSPMEATTLDEISSTTRKYTNRTESPILPHQKFVLRIKLLLEHTNEKEDKESLIEVEKNVVLTGNEAKFGQTDFLEQIRALNRSINLEVIEALFNYTSLGELSKYNNISWVTERSPRISKRSNTEEENEYSEKTIEEVNGVLYADTSRMTDDSWYKEIEYNLPDIYEDVTTGLSEIFTIFPAKKDSFKSMKSKLTDDTKNQIPKKSSKNTMEEVGRWWKERTDQIYIGGRIRSVTQLTLYQI